MDRDQIRFGRFRLDPRRRELLRDDHPIRIGRRALDILCALAAAGGEVVSKDELMTQLWAGRTVEEGNIHVHVSALRKALDEEGDGHSYVMTVPGRGYRLAGIDGLAPRERDCSPPSSVADTLTMANAQDEPRDRPRIIERRHLTVISCEFGGAARLATRLDPEELSAAMAALYRRCSETVGRFGGTVTRLTSDDVLAYFGYPHAHEHDAEQAVRAGLALVGEIPSLGFETQTLHVRLGIATGAVVVEDLIGGRTSERGFLGETLNLAGSLRRFALPNTVVIAATTRQLVGDLFEVRGISNTPVDDLGVAISAYEVLGTSAVDSRFEALHGSSLTKLVGREEELELLLRRWQQAKSDEMRVVLITGEPGIGKSRLCVELRERIRSEPSTCLRYFCSPHHQDSALYPVIRQLETAAGFARNDTIEAKRDKVEALNARLSGSEEEKCLLLELLSLSTGANTPQLTSRRTRDLTFEMLIRQITVISSKQPILMLFEDAHWSDPTTLELLELLIKRVGQGQILLLITFRPEFIAPWTGHAHVTTITLSRLDRRESAALVRRAIGDDVLNGDVIEEVAERADGIPLFLEELSKALVESNETLTIDTPGARSRSQRNIPATLQASLMARLDRLDPSTKEVAQIGAAIGREFPHELIAAVYQEARPLLDTALQSLVAIGLVFRRGAPPNETFLFKHGLVQDTVYSTLPRNRRLQLHADLAEALEQLLPETVQQQPELFAYHFSAAERPTTAIQYWRMAIERALRTSAYVEAVGHCKRALRGIGSIEPRAHRLREEVWLQLQLGIALTASQGTSSSSMLEAFNRAHAVAEELGDDRSRASALLGLWAYHNAKAYLRPALGFAQRLLAIGESRGDRGTCVQAHAASLTVSYKLGTFEDAWRHFQRGTALYRPSMRIIEVIPNYTSPGPDMLLHGSFVAWVMGYPGRARTLASATMRTARKLNQPYILTHCVYMLGHLAELQEEWQTVRKANEETVELATRWGFTGTMQLVGRRIALVAVVIDGDQEQFRFKCEHRQPGFARSLHDVVLARTCASLGIAEQGLKLLDEALAYSQQCGSCFYDAEVYRTQGRLLASLRRWTEAEHSYLSGIDTARRQRAHMWELRSASDLAALWADRGKRQQAIDLLAPVYGWFTEGFDTPDLQAAKATLEGLGHSHFRTSS